MFKYGISQDDKANDEFSNFIHESKIKEKNLSYCSIGFTDYKNDESKIIIENREWLDCIKKNEVNKYCPIFKAFDDSKNNYILLSRYKYKTQKERQIYKERKHFENTKGILRMFRFKDFKFSISACTNYQHFDEEEFLIKENEFFSNLCNFSEELVRKYLINNNITGGNDEK